MASRSLFPLLAALVCQSVLTTDSAEARDRLTASQLAGGIYRLESPLDNHYYMPIGERLPAMHSISGSIAFRSATMTLSNPALEAGMDYFPSFTAEFFTVDGMLVPSDREIVGSFYDRSYWRIILGIGNVWSEASDGGKSRASFPFTLVGPFYNQAHNGLATFVYDESSVSSVVVQVVQETTEWYQTDMTATVSASYTPRPVSEANYDAFNALLEDRVLTRPWSELPFNVSSEETRMFNSWMSPEKISQTGAIVDGVLYSQDPITRYGDYPYPDDMRHGAFSVTKSLGALIALLRLAEKYGESVLDERIVDYVDLAPGHNGWAGVTFSDCLNMATGIGDGLNDERSQKLEDWSRALSIQQKLDAASRFGNYSWDPGVRMRYNTTHTFVLGVAMDTYLKREEGPAADIWDVLKSEVLIPIGVHDAPMMRTIEPLGRRGLPLFGVGMYPTIGDIAKMTGLLQQLGNHDGQQLLHRELTAEALFRIDQPAGLITGNVYNGRSQLYHLSHWSYPYSESIDGSSIRLVRHAPYMSGYGGNTVLLADNGVTTFRFADQLNYSPIPLGNLASRIRTTDQFGHSLAVNGIGGHALEWDKEIDAIVYDGMAMTGSQMSVHADPNKVIRIYYLDESDDIVVVEFKGDGAVTIELTPDSREAAQLPLKYGYDHYLAKGLAEVSLAGSSESTYLSVFPLGPVSQVAESIFLDGERYDGRADLKSIQISGSGLGGLYCGSACFSGSDGLVGIDASSVPIRGRVAVGGIAAYGDGEPSLLLGSDSELDWDSGAVLVASSTLEQPNGRPVTVSGFNSILSIASRDSNGEVLSAERIVASFADGQNEAVELSVSMDSDESDWVLSAPFVNELMGSAVGAVPTIVPIGDRQIEEYRVALSASSPYARMPLGLSVSSGHARIDGDQILLTGVGEVAIRANLAETPFSDATSVEETFTVSEVANPEGDADGDGVSNIVETAFGMNVESRDSSMIPSISIDQGLARYSFRPYRTDLRYLVESSSDLESWSTESTVHTEIDGRMELEVQVSPPKDGSEFLRLRVEAVE